jgi:hypothetical protein
MSGGRSRVHPERWQGRLLLVVLMLAGCSRERSLPAYQDGQGFQITPPPGWVERERPANSPTAAAPGGKRRPANVPLPPLGVIGPTDAEQLLIRYDRITAGSLAWLRVTMAEVPESRWTSLEAALEGRLPKGDWRRESKVENLEVGGMPAARIALVGRWDDQDYLCEIVAVRKGERTYLITASFPASDETARKQVRQSVAGVRWR